MQEILHRASEVTNLHRNADESMAHLENNQNNSMRGVRKSLDYETIHHMTPNERKRIDASHSHAEDMRGQVESFRKSQPRAALKDAR